MMDLHAELKRIVGFDAKPMMCPKDQRVRDVASLITELYAAHRLYRDCRDRLRAAVKGHDESRIEEWNRACALRLRDVRDVWERLDAALDVIDQALTEKRRAA